MVWRLFTVALLLFAHQLFAASGTYTYDYSSNCSKAYQHYLALHTAEGRAHIIAEIKTNPYNLMATYVSDYEDCLLLLLTCDPAEYEQRKGHFDARLELLEKGSETSPWYRFCKAGLYMHWAIVHTRFGENYKAALKFRKALSLIKENERLFPAFEYNNVYTGLKEAIVGSLPGNYKWLAAIFGLKGNTKQGVGKLASFVNTHTAAQAMHAEAVLYYSYTRFYLLAEHKEVWNFFNSPAFVTHNNLMNTFAKANIGLDHHKTDDFISALQDAAADPNYSRYPILEFQMGLALLTKADLSCIGYFQKFLEKNKGDVFLKEAWEKQALAWYIKGDMKQAEYCRNQIDLTGVERLDADKQAQKFYEKKTWPIRKLLQARLLLDGGYAGQALTVLSGISMNALPNAADKSEYYFRLGKAYEELSDNKKAIANYASAINIGKNRHEQFAARAALQTGVIYEHTGMKSNALKSYRQCLDMPSHDFQNSIDQLAKAGINRLE